MMMSDIIGAGLTRAAIQSPSAWAKQYRVMGNPLEGPWTFKHHPWLKGMMDSTSPDNVGMKGAQLGFTEAMVNITFYFMDMLKLDCLYALPAKTPDATDFSTGRVNPAIELSPHLSRIFSSTKNVGHKQCGSTNLYIRGARSRGSFKSIPTGLVICDEIDEWAPEMVALVMARLTGQKEEQRCLWRISTPGINNKGVDVYYQAGTQEHYFFKCPHCSRLTELLFPQCIEITAESYLDPDVKNSFLKCKECNTRLDHRTKSDWIHGEWIPAIPDREIRSFHVNQLYSPTEPPGGIAKAYLRGQLTPEDEQEFYNSQLGLPHIVEGSKVTRKEIEAALSNKTLDSDIRHGAFLTLGIDVGTWLHWVLVSWLFDGDSKDVDIHYRTQADVVRLGKVKHFDEITSLFQQYRPAFGVIDAQPERREALRIAKRLWGSMRICFYGRGVDGKELKVPMLDDPEGVVDPSVTVDRTAWLDVSLGRFRNRSVRLPADTPEEFKQHVEALVRRYEKDKCGTIARYENTGPDHFMHAFNYAEIALEFALHKQVNRPIRTKVL